MTWRNIYNRRKALNEEWKTMFGKRPFGKFMNQREKKAWENYAQGLEEEAKGPGLMESAVGYGLTRAAGRIATAPIDIAVDYAKHVMKKNYDRGFMEYRAKPYYVNYHIRPIWVRRRRTAPYRPNLKAYSLPFYYSRAGPAYQHNRRTRNFWYWRR